MESLKSWLFQVAKNRCIDELRKRKRRVQHSLERELDNEASALLMSIDTAPLPETYAEQGEERQRIATALQVLPLKIRRVIWLRYSQDLTFDEIERQLSMLPATAKTYYYRACRQLRQILA